MSRIGKKSIQIPLEVVVILGPILRDKNQKIIIQGKYGLLEKKINSELLLVCYEEDQLKFERNTNTKQAREYHGLMRVLVQNMVYGVTIPFSRTLIAEGVGYKFIFGTTKTNVLIINAGYADPIRLTIPTDITIKFESPIKITLSAIDKEKVGAFASLIRSVRPPEPYKGKGILYAEEKVRRKVGKTGK